MKDDEGQRMQDGGYILDIPVYILDIPVYILDRMQDDEG